MYKLGDNTTHSRKVRMCWISSSVTNAEREFTLDIVSLRKFFDPPGGGHCPLVRDGEPTGLLETPESPTLYMLIKTIV